ncbi:MAG TPA: hypothetical protein PKA76_12080 [Pirellulaceae bacterium]|nr:hypothetical protein [Pirellulaceae bacterium]
MRFVAAKRTEAADYNLIERAILARWLRDSIYFIGFLEILLGYRPAFKRHGKNGTCRDPWPDFNVSLASNHFAGAVFTYNAGYANDLHRFQAMLRA